MNISKVITLGAVVLAKIIFNNLIEIHKVIAVFSLHKSLDLHIIITSPKSSKSWERFSLQGANHGFPSNLFRILCGKTMESPVFCHNWSLEGKISIRSSKLSSTLQEGGIDWAFIVSDPDTRM